MSSPIWNRLFPTLLRILRLRDSSGMVSLILSAVVVGVLVGLAAVGFDLMVHSMGVFVHQARVSMGNVWGPLITVFIPALGGLLITPIVLRISPDVRGSGIPAVMLAVSNFGGRIAKRVALWRPIATTLSIGTGASLGTEGPVVQMGGSLASMLSDLLKLNDERRRSLVAVAAASGIAATFNAPIAGVLFALEVVLRQFNNRYFAAVVIGAVSASAVSGALLGSSPAFPVPADFQLGSPVELVYYFILGILAGLLSIAFIRIIILGENTFARLPVSPWLKPMLGGLMVGALALLLPVLGRGYSQTAGILNGEITGLGFLFGLMLLKMIATSISLGSFGAGGILAPALLIGAAFGGGFGQVLSDFGLPVNIGAFALVGMAAVFSGTTRAPMSSIIMIFEISGGYDMILPLLFAAVIATLIGDALHPESVYQVMLSRRGLSLLSARESDLLQSVRVQEVMDKAPLVYRDDSLEALSQTLLETHHHGFVVVSRDEPNQLYGVVTLGDLEEARRQALAPSTLVEAICSTEVHTCLPDEAVSEVLERMGELGIGRMPVVDPAKPKRLLGFVRQTDLARAYYQALQRQRQLGQKQDATRLRSLTGQDIIEIKLRSDSPLAYKTLREAALPKESIVVAIRRGNQTVFPHGDTRLEPGDTVVANVAPGFSKQFREFF